MTARPVTWLVLGRLGRLPVVTQVSARDASEAVALAVDDWRAINPKANAACAYYAARGRIGVNEMERSNA